MGLKALVTGGTGFIGSNLIEGLIENDWEVYALIRKNSTIGYRRLKKFKNINYVYAEDAFTSITGKVYPQFDVCFHLASYGVDYRQQNLDNLINGNIKFTLDLLRFCKRNKTKKVIITGTCYEYGVDEKRKISENQIIKPQGLYASAKASAVMMANVYAKMNDINLITVRPFGIFGENEGAHKLVPQTIRAAINSKVIPVTEGNQVRDYLYIKNLIEAYILLARAEVPPYEFFNVCSSDGISIKEFLLKIAKVINGNKNLLEFGALPYRKNEVMYFVGDNTKIKKYTGWNVKYDIDSGIKNTYEWYKNNMEVLQ